MHAWLQCQLHRRPNTNTSKNQALVGLNVTIDCNHHVCLVNIKLSLSYLSIAVKGGNSLVSDFLEVPLVAWQLQGYETGNNFFALKTELVFFFVVCQTSVILRVLVAIFICIFYFHTRAELG